jgi:hypothetical protein
MRLANKHGRDFNGASLKTAVMPSESSFFLFLQSLNPPAQPSCRQQIWAGYTYLRVDIPKTSFAIAGKVNCYFLNTLAH